MSTSSFAPTTSYLDRPDGRIAYDQVGKGPLLVLVPGMGDLRSSYRHLAPRLAEAGFQVVTCDLRGHGDSDPTFASYGDAETAGDLLALVESFGRPAVLVGNSMAAGAAVIAAARKPELVSGLVLLGPFVRDPAANPAIKLAMRVLMAPAWAPTVWRGYLPSLYAGRKPADFEEYRGRVVAALRRPGYARAFSRTTHISHADAAASLSSVAAPTLVVMGAADPDFPDPAAEAAWIADALQGEFAIIPDAGHYPQSQQPDATLAALLPFLAGLPASRA